MMSGTYAVTGAQVACGNVQTANATVYIINTVLMPPRPDRPFAPALARPAGPGPRR